MQHDMQHEINKKKSRAATPFGYATPSKTDKPFSIVVLNNHDALRSATIRHIHSALKVSGLLKIVLLAVNSLPSFKHLALSVEVVPACLAVSILYLLPPVCINSGA